MKFFKKDDVYFHDVDMNTSNCTVTYLVPPKPACVKDSKTDEIIIGFLVILLVVFAFYRFYHVWAYKLNFSEVSLKTSGQCIVPFQICLTDQISGVKKEKKGSFNCFSNSILPHLQ